MRNNLKCSVERSRPFRITRFTLGEPLEAGSKPYRMVHLTDLHYGITTRKVINTAVLLTNSLQPDAIFITGDFIQGDRLGSPMFGLNRSPVPLAKFRKFRDRARRLAEELADELKELRAAGTILATLGNHDYYEGVKIIVEALPSSYQWLVNRSITLRDGSSTISVTGLDDYKRGTPNLAVCEDEIKLRSGLASHFRILLTHNPDSLIAAPPDLLRRYAFVFAGHTHGGQICLPGGRPIVTRTTQMDHVKGLSWRENTAIYVSNGVGYGGIALRTFCPPEVVVLDLYPSWSGSINAAD